MHRSATHQILVMTEQIKSHEKELTPSSSALGEEPPEYPARFIPLFEGHRKH
jgi:hypothetical protein